jgi:hypothetical protein
MPVMAFHVSNRIEVELFFSFNLWAVQTANRMIQFSTAQAQQAKRNLKPTSRSRVGQACNLIS